MGFFSSSSSSQLNPYAPAKGHMDNALGALGGQQWNPYSGSYAAAMNPQYQQALQGALNFAGPQGAGAQYANQMTGIGNDLYNTGMTNYTNLLSAQMNRGAPQFRMDQGTFQQTMDNLMPGMDAAASFAGRMNSRALDSQLGQLMGAAGASGQFGSKLSSKLAGNAAAASALSQEALGKTLGNMYMNAANTANANAMSAGNQNLAATQRNTAGLMQGYGNLMNTGINALGSGYNAGVRNAGLGMTAGGAMQDYDKYKAAMDQKQWYDNTFGQQQFNMNKLQGIGNIASTFGKQTTTSSPSGLGKLGSMAGLAGSVFGGFGGMGGLSSLFGGNSFNPMGDIQSDPTTQWWM